MMRIKSTNYSLLNYGLKTLLIASLFYSCELSQVKNIFFSSQLQNPGLTFLPDQKSPEGWQLEKNNNFSLEKRSVNSYDKPFISSQKPGEILFSQSITLDSGDYFVMAKYNVNVTEGGFFIKTNHSLGIEILSSGSTCLRTIFVLPVKSTQDVKFQFGFIDGSVGSALLDTIMIHKTEYKVAAEKSNESKVQLIEKNLSLSLRQDETLDQNVNLFAESINSAFLSKKDMVSQPPILTYSSSIFKDKYTSYLATYINDEKVRNAYCQKLSLSLDELLRLYQIPTRQLHWQKDCSGFHQFLEYYNKYDDKWKIIDPYYGVRYVDQNGNYLNFEEIERLVRNNNFSSKNIKQIDIRNFYYSQSEILEGWANASLAVHVLNK